MKVKEENKKKIFKLISIDPALGHDPIFIFDSIWETI